MGNHAFYLVLAYGMSALLLLAEFVFLFRRWRNTVLGNDVKAMS